MDISKHEVLADLHDLGMKIEELGCSEELTNVSVRIGEISEKVAELVDSVGTGPFKIKTLEQARYEMVANCLKLLEGNRTKTAEALGVSVRTIGNYIQEMKEKGLSVADPSNCLGHIEASKDHNYKMPTNKERLRLADKPEIIFMRKC